MIRFKDFCGKLLKESRFTSIESNITEPEITPLIARWIKEVRKTYKLPEEAEAFRELVNNQDALLLGELQVGRKSVKIWIQDIPTNGYWVEKPKKASYILVSLNLIVNNPAKALSTVVHELIHGIQKYRKESEKFTLANSKTEDETQEEMFDYYTEPKELEAQLGELAHAIVTVYRQKRNKEQVLKALEMVLRLPQEQFHNEDWYHQKPYGSLFIDMFGHFHSLLRSISKPPTNSLRHKQLSDKSWRQFKQKLFSLVQQLNEV